MRFVLSALLISQIPAAFATALCSSADRSNWGTSPFYAIAGAVQSAAGTNVYLQALKDSTLGGIKYSSISSQCSTCTIGYLAGAGQGCFILGLLADPGFASCSTPLEAGWNATCYTSLVSNSTNTTSSAERSFGLPLAFVLSILAIMAVSL